MDRESRSLPVALIAVLAAAALPLVFLNLGAAALLDPDEPYYAAPALEMLRAGAWTVPIFHGQPWFDKPILFYWIVLASFKVFGVSEWSARIGSALAGLGGAVAIATLAPSRWKRGGTCVLAAVVLATSLEYAVLSRAAITDMTLTLFLTLGFLALARHFESRSFLSALGAGAAWGLATLTKGPVGLIVPALALVGWRLAAGRGAALRLRSWWALLAGCVATGAPWYLYMAAEHRDLLVTTFLGQGNLARFASPEHVQFPLFYVAVFALGLLPWSAALPAALIRGFRGVVRRGGSDPTPELRVFALVWFLAVVFLFSLSASKLITYVLPAFPAAALLIADYWREAFVRRAGGAPMATGARIVAWTGAAMSLGVGIALIVVGRGSGLVEARGPLVVTAVILAVAGLAAAAAVRQGQLGTFVTAQAASTVAGVLVLVVFVVPRLEGSKSTRNLVAELDARGLQGELAGAYRVPDVSLDFYLGAPLRRETNPGSLARRVSAEPGRLWIFRTGEIDAVAAEAGLAVERIASSPRRSVVRLTPEGVAR